MRNRFRLTLQMVAAAASKRRRISVFSRTLSAHWRNVENLRLALYQNGDLKLGMKVFAVGAMTIRAAAGTLPFDERAGQHFTERTEAANEFAAQFQAGVAGRFHMTLIIVSEESKVKHLWRFARMPSD